VDCQVASIADASRWLEHARRVGTERSNDQAANILIAWCRAAVHQAASHAAVADRQIGMPRRFNRLPGAGRCALPEGDVFGQSHVARLVANKLILW